MATNRADRIGGWEWKFKNARNHTHASNLGIDSQTVPRKVSNPNIKKIEVLATLIYITNFPKEWNEKNIWNSCKEFGIVVDVYLSPRLSKVGKKFAFVRFL